MSSVTFAAQTHAAVIEHLESLHDTRDYLIASGDPNTDIASIDNEIESYAREYQDAFATWIKHCAAKREGIKAHRKSLTEPYQRAESHWETREAAARALALRLTKQHGELRGDVFSIQRNVSKRLDVFDESQIPAEYIVITRTVDREKVTKALRAGKDIPGAQLVDGSEFVTVRGL